ncbi:MAG TPA: tRNA (N(6)-L-threonylcarbamoyladenosine(37)-C(2))-methylthiotransferase MtaB [Bacteroidales bacterium]|nr:tRNA (N(6)-L-threonylcarbamoyladenosine(37)-C(2))-methylthiotransferase MtaB [Bacteroidales bacterium]HPR72616.1 tRNA (N(6)-L-threonylcarbamoyladenosine(37)-C(2))-methylthiotransferase MtaB [Bacteroidales bacterium]
MNTLRKKKIAFHTLGCKLNFAETSTISRTFPEDKYEKVTAGQKADIYVINTCTVTEVADKKCRQAIRKFRNLSPEAMIVAIGCYSQLRPHEIAAIPGVDMVLGTNERFGLVEMMENYGKRSPCEIHCSHLSESDPFIPAFSAGDRTRSFLKVQDGCDYGCAYCTIPLARGSSRSPGIDTVLEEASVIAEKGIKEIILTGVNIGDFGRKNGQSLYNLLCELVKIKGIERYRISSIEPNLLTDELIEMTADNPKILPHFHIPLQGGSDKILALMGRRYKRDVFSKKIQKIRSLIPLAGIGSDILTGFPGENDEDFEDAYNFLSDQPLSYMHVFPYSERPGTRAVNMEGKVNHHVKELRSKRLHALSEKKHDIFLKNNIGHNENVLFESVKNKGMITGFTGNYIRVEYPWDQSFAGKIKKIRMKNIEVSGRMSVEIIS